MFYSVLPSETQGKQKSRNLTLILPDSKSSSLCTHLDEVSQWRRESNKMKEEKANCILMLAQSYSKGQPAICQASPTQQRRQKKPSWSQSNHSLSLSFIRRAAPQGPGEEGMVWGGSSQPMSWCWQRAGWLPSPSQCDILVTSLHAHGTPQDSVYFSHPWDDSLNIWHRKDWRLPDRLGRHPRWVSNQQCQRGRKTRELREIS